MNFTRIIHLSLLLCSALVLNGCFDYQERIVLNKDASGTMDVDYWTMNDVNLENDGYSFPSKEDDIRREVENKYTSDRVKLLDFKVTDEKDSRHVQFKVAFDHVLDLNDVEQFQKNRIKFTEIAGKITFERSVFLNDGDSDSEDEPDNWFGKLVLGVVKQGLSNIRFRFEVDTPYAIDATNADSKPGKNSAVWKYRLSDVMGQGDIKMTLTTGSGTSVI